MNILYIVATVIACALVGISWSSDAVPLYQVGLIVGGIVLGFVVTDALNETH